MLEASVQMWFETEMYHDWVVVAVDVCVDSVQTLEDLSEETGKGFGERNAYQCDNISDESLNMRRTLNTYRCDWGTSVHCRRCSVPKS